MAILVVEDETDLSDLLSYMLRQAGHDVLVAFDGESAIRIWKERRPELVLLDLGLPKRSGWDVCREILSQSSTPVVIVSGADEEENLVQGFDMGALDYVVKPFSPRLLKARIRAALRRAQAAPMSYEPEANMVIGDLSLDADTRMATCGGKSVRLTRLEYKVLRELAVANGQVVAHEQLIERVWNYTGEDSSNILKGHIRGIRIKLEQIGSRTHIGIVPGVGYALEAGV